MMNASGDDLGADIRINGVCLEERAAGEVDEVALIVDAAEAGDEDRARAADRLAVAGDAGVLVEDGADTVSEGEGSLELDLPGLMAGEFGHAEVVERLARPFLELGRAGGSGARKEAGGESGGEQATPSGGSADASAAHSGDSMCIIRSHGNPHWVSGSGRLDWGY